MEATPFTVLRNPKAEARVSRPKCLTMISGCSGGKKPARVKAYNSYTGVPHT